MNRFLIAIFCLFTLIGCVDRSPAKFKYGQKLSLSLEDKLSIYDRCEGTIVKFLGSNAFGRPYYVDVQCWSKMELVFEGRMIYSEVALDRNRK